MLLWLVVALLHARQPRLNVQAESVPAMYVFGDSLVDSGNNNVLRTTSRANHPPYGYNFENHDATGRFCDGRLIPDMLALKLGLPLPPPFLTAEDDETVRGANFGSASSGVSRWTGQGAILTFADQVDGFRAAQHKLVRRFGQTEALNHISRSIFYVCTANNDVNNFLLRFRRLGLPEDVRDSLLMEFATEIERLYNLGARKFVVVGLSAVGCIPMNQFFGHCSTRGVDASTFYNEGLTTVLDSLRLSLSGVHIVLANFQALMLEVQTRPRLYGFSNTAQGCCPVFQPWRWCYNGAEFCDNPSRYMYWDMVHPTQAFNMIAAQRWWNGTRNDVSPMNIRDLAKLNLL